MLRNLFLSHIIEAFETIILFNINVNNCSHHTLNLKQNNLFLYFLPGPFFFFFVILWLFTNEVLLFFQYSDQKLMP